MGFSESIQRFEQLIQDKEAELVQYQNSQKPSEKAIHFKRGEIARLRGFLEAVMDENQIWRAAFEQQADALKKLKRKIEQLEEIKMALEGICLLHGIDDLPIWINRPLPQIIYDVKNSRAEGWRQVPAAFEQPVSFSEAFPEIAELIKSGELKQIEYGQKQKE